MAVGAGVGLVVFVGVWALTGYVAGPIWGVSVFLPYAIGLHALLGLLIGLTVQVPFRVAVLWLGLVAGGAVVGVGLGLLAGTWVHEQFEADPTGYFQLSGTREVGEPAASVTVLIATSLAGMLAGGVVGLRSLLGVPGAARNTSESPEEKGVGHVS